jgi:lactam utilization protein B
MSYLVLPKAGLRLASLEEARALAEQKAKDTKAEQVILQAVEVTTPRLEVVVTPYGEQANG